MGAIRETVRSKLGDAALDPALKALAEFFDDTRLDTFLGVVDTLYSFDPQGARRLLTGAPGMFAGIVEDEHRAGVVKALGKMGRAKWSVISAAVAHIPALNSAGGSWLVAWLERADALAELDQDAALAYISATEAVLELLGPDEFLSWASLGHDIAQDSWKAAKEYFKASPEVLPRITPGEMQEWVSLGIHLIRESPSMQAAYNAQSLLAVGAAAGKSKKQQLGVEYFRSSPEILSRLSVKDLAQWVHRGLQTAETQKDKGASFFSLRSGKSREAVEGLVQGLELKDIHTVLRGFAEALTGDRILLRSSELFYTNLPGLAGFLAVTDGARVFLPSQLAVFSDPDRNFKTYKLLLAHELAHLRFGTFDLEDEHAVMLKNDADPLLAGRLFEFLEDERVDYLMAEQFPGLRVDREEVCARYRKDQEAAGVGLSLFERISMETGSERGAAHDEDGVPMSVEQGIREAVLAVRNAGCSATDVAEMAVKLTRELDGLRKDDVARVVVGAPGLFHRGVVDLELVRNTRADTAELMARLRSGLGERRREIDDAMLHEAVERLEEAEGLVGSTFLRARNDRDAFEDLFEQLQRVLDEMEAEKYFRRAVHYDEWDAGLDDYRKEWCHVREMDMPEQRSTFYQDALADNYGVVSLLRRHFAMLRPDRIRRYFREERGDDVDLDALIEAIVDHRAGVTPSDRVFIRREKNLRDVSVAFLVDMSYSTGDELPSGKRIIDVEREGLVLMAEALESIGDQWAVYGFSSDRRNKVDFYIVRDFDMQFGDDVKTRFANIRPMAQTRLGAVIRHATALLRRQSSRIRLLILLSDGRPYDVDYGDAAHAVEDTRRALWEARQRGINSFCITVDKKSREYLPYMYGDANFTLIENVDALPAMLPLIYKRLTS